MKSVLLIGGLGYIGRHIALQLQSRGIHIVIVDNLRSETAKSSYVTTSNNIIIDDVRRYTSWLPRVENIEFQSIIHLAQLKSVRESVENPDLYARYNSETTNAVLTIASILNIPNILFSSSATVYKPADHPFVETDPLGPTNPYGQSKLKSEMMLLDSGRNVQILRYFNPVFAISSEYEEIQTKPENLIPALHESVKTGTTFKIFGGDYPTKDGTAVRDYIHVAQLAEYHYHALMNLSGTTEIVNVGSSHGQTVLEMILAYELRYLHKIKYEIVDRRPGDQAIVIANIDKAKRLLWANT